MTTPKNADRSFIEKIQGWLQTRPEIRKVLLGYILIFVVSTLFVLLHIPFSYLRVNPEGAATNFRHFWDVWAVVVIATLAAILIGPVEIKSRFERLFFLVYSLAGLSLFILTGVELMQRQTPRPWNQIFNNYSFFNVYGITTGSAPQLFEAYNWPNYNLPGILLSLLTVGNTFRELLWWWVIVPIFDKRYPAPVVVYPIGLLALFSLMVLLLGAGYGAIASG